MKYLFLFLLFAGLSVPSTAGVPPRLERINIGESGCSAYLPKGMPPFDVSFSDDEAQVYTSEIQLDEFAFGCITVKFASPFSDDSEDDLQELLINYMEFLQTTFSIASSAGVGKGHKMESNPRAVGVIDYWEDNNGNQYAVKGWVDEKYLSVMYIVGPGDYPAIGLQEMYLNGFRFTPKP